MSEPNRVVDYTQITAHVEQSRKRLTPALRGKARIEALLRSMTEEVQIAENVLWALLTLTLSNAVGEQLDRIGRLLGQARGSLGDTDYRAVLRGTVKARRSSGTVEQLYEIGRLVTGGINVRVREGAASIYVEPVAPHPAGAAVLLRMMQLAKAGGVSVCVADPPLAESALFTFSSDPMRSQSSATQGFADDAQTTGGHLTGAIS